MLDFLKHLFSADFLPHGHCFFWTPSILWLHVVSDAIIATAYYSIPVALVYLVRKRTDLAFNWMFILFAGFILACGTTHVMGIWEMWHGTYRLGGLVKAGTAAISIGTAIALWPLIPHVLRLPSQQQLRRVNEALQGEILERERATEAARTLAEELERRVRERTAQLETAVQELQAEIAERERVQSALRESEERKTAILRSALDAVVTMDHLGRIVEFNPAAEAMFGWTQGVVVGKSVGDTIVPRRLREAHLEGLARYLQTGEGPVIGKRIEMAGIRADGSEFPLELSIVRVGEREPPTFTGFLRDITVRKQTEEALASLNAELEERVAARTRDLELANKDLESFSYSVSHDLRAPLRSIDGFSKALLEDQWHLLDEPGKQNLHRVRAASQRMGQLIDDMLQLARVTRTEMRDEEVDLSALATSLLAELRDSQPARALESHVTEGAHVRGDARLLRLVMSNLLENAWKFTGQRDVARIEFGTMAGEEEDVFFVKDNGAGFDMAHAGKLFGVFQRLHAMKDFPGTGVGLATVQRIVRRHGGRTWAEAEPDRGATFFFSLPRRRSTP